MKLRGAITSTPASLESTSKAHTAHTVDAPKTTTLDPNTIGPTRALALTLGIESNFQSRVPAKYFGWLSSIRKLRDELMPLSDAELRGRLDTLSEKVKAGASLTSVLPESFAITRETSRRTLGMEHYEVQLLAGMALIDKSVAQLETGEGKTLSASLAASLLALQGNGVHVVTTSGYLAGRDAEELRPLYEGMGLSVGSVQSTQTYDEKRDAYSADITYGHCNTFAFDWLEDQIWWQDEWRVQRPLAAAIVDEADDVLLDTAQQPLVLCGSQEDVDSFRQREKIIRLASEIAGELDTPGNVTIYFEKEEKRPQFSDQGVNTLQRLVAEKLDIPNDPELVWTPDNADLIGQVRKAVEARYAVSLGRQYIAGDDQVTLIDEATGHPNPDGRLRHGLMDAVLMKEGQAPEPALSTIGMISYQHFFNMYGHLSGMTGTARGGKEELRDLYGLQVVEVPPRKEPQRVDHPDAFFPHPAHRDLQMVADVLDTHATGQPVLISTVDVSASKHISQRLADPMICLADVAASSGPLLEACLERVEGGAALLSGVPSNPSDEDLAATHGEILELLKADPKGTRDVARFLDEHGMAASKLLESGVEHRTLNAETAKEEAEVIGRAGERSAVTVATQIAGRGVDIPLGEGVEDLGGLFVFGLEHKTNARKDAQARGRAGRQGTKGETRFYVSAADDVFSFLPAHKLRKLASGLGANRLEAPTGALRRGWESAVKKAQKGAELNKEMERRRSTKLDSVIKIQRKQHMMTRNEVLECDDLVSQVRSWIHTRIDERAVAAKIGKTPRSSEVLERLVKDLDKQAPSFTSSEVTFDILASFNPSQDELPETMTLPEIHEWADARIDAALPAAELASGDEGLEQHVRGVVLFHLDKAWVSHLLEQEQEKETAYLAAYGEQDPWSVFTKQAAHAYRGVMHSVRAEAAEGMMFHLSQVSADQAPPTEATPPTSPS